MRIVGYDTYLQGGLQELITKIQKFDIRKIVFFNGNIDDHNVEINTTILIIVMILKNARNGRKSLY